MRTATGPPPPGPAAKEGEVAGAGEAARAAAGALAGTPQRRASHWSPSQLNLQSSVTYDYPATTFRFKRNTSKDAQVEQKRGRV